MPPVKEKHASLPRLGAVHFGAVSRNVATSDEARRIEQAYERLVALLMPHALAHSNDNQLWGGVHEPRHTEGRAECVQRDGDPQGS